MIYEHRETGIRVAVEYREITDPPFRLPGGVLARHDGYSLKTEGGQELQTADDAMFPPRVAWIVTDRGRLRVELIEKTVNQPQRVHNG